MHQVQDPLIMLPSLDTAIFLCSESIDPQTDPDFVNPTPPSPSSWRDQRWHAHHFSILGIQAFVAVARHFRVTRNEARTNDGVKRVVVHWHILNTSRKLLHFFISLLISSALM